MRVRVAAISGHGIDRLDLLRAELEQELLRPRDDLVLVHAGTEHPVDLLVDRIDDPAGVIEQRHLVDALELPRLEHHARAVGDMEAGPAESLDAHEVGHVDPERLALEPALAQLVGDRRGESVGDPRLGRHRTPHRRDPRPEVLGREPRRVQLVMPGGRAEIPEDRIVAPHEQHPAGVLVAGPLPDVGARHVADVVRVEEQQRSEIGRREHLLRTREPVGAQPCEVDPLLPVDAHRRSARRDVQAPVGQPQVRGLCHVAPALVASAAASRRSRR